MVEKRRVRREAVRPWCDFFSNNSRVLNYSKNEFAVTDELTCKGVLFLYHRLFSGDSLKNPSRRRHSGFSAELFRCFRSICFFDEYVSLQRQHLKVRIPIQQEHQRGIPLIVQRAWRMRAEEIKHIGGRVHPRIRFKHPHILSYQIFVIHTRRSSPFYRIDINLRGCKNPHVNADQQPVKLCGHLWQLRTKYLRDKGEKARVDEKIQITCNSSSATRVFRKIPY